MTVTDSPKPSFRLCHLVHASIIAALAVGATVSGAGIGTADTVTNEVDVESSQPTPSTPWRVHNFTDQPLTAGEFHRDQGANVGSALLFGGDTPQSTLEPGGVTDEALQQPGPAFNQVRTWGRVCYLGQAWNMPRSTTYGFDWQNMYVFAMDDGHGSKKLMITPEGGHRDVDMNAYGEPC